MFFTCGVKYFEKYDSEILTQALLLQISFADYLN